MFIGDPATFRGPGPFHGIELRDAYALTDFLRGALGAVPGAPPGRAAGFELRMPGCSARVCVWLATAAVDGVISALGALSPEARLAVRAVVLPDRGDPAYMAREGWLEAYRQSLEVGLSPGAAPRAARAACSIEGNAVRVPACAAGAVAGAGVRGACPLAERRGAARRRRGTQPHAAQSAPHPAPPTPSSLAQAQDRVEERLFSGVAQPGNAFPMIATGGPVTELCGGGHHEGGKAQGVLGELLGWRADLAPHICTATTPALAKR